MFWENEKDEKTVSLLLAVMMLLSLAACGGDTAADRDDGDTSKPPQDGSGPDESTGGTDSESKPEDNELSFTETVAVDNDECSVKITGIDPDNLWGYTLKAQLENKSADKTYMFAVDSAAINGVVCDPLFATDVAPGKKSNNDISFIGDTLDKNGVGDYTDIELTFRVYDSNDWLADPVAYETVHIYPYGEDKAVSFVRQAQPDDNIIIDNDAVTAIVTGYEDDAIWGFTVKLFFLNKTDKNVIFSADEVSVNGFMADPFFAASVPAGKCSFVSMFWSDTTFEESGITDVDEIEFTLRAHDSDDLMADDLVNEPVTLNP